MSVLDDLVAAKTAVATLEADAAAALAVAEPDRAVRAYGNILTAVRECRCALEGEVGARAHTQVYWLWPEPPVIGGTPEVGQYLDLVTDVYVSENGPYILEYRLWQYSGSPDFDVPHSNIYAGDDTFPLQDGSSPSPKLSGSSYDLRGWYVRLYVSIKTPDGSRSTDLYSNVIGPVAS
jgi:hypothetical protein